MIVAVIHGPNLNLLGVREPDVYGSVTMSEINERIEALAEELGIEVTLCQHNSEGAIIDAIHQAGCEADGIVINPAGYTHTSVAIHDALKAVPLPAIEVHLSNILAREDWRKLSMTAPACAGVISGLGAESYLLAVRGIVAVVEAGE
ncbi:MAG: type II 3-dehydroquinate dehydratase [candidate division WS1 bacterium]|jgi:3-dehydroquinate dehydratase-2|nr:type II 3-dehydroquinate dehydratase [candidate division WS1 bacterium]